MWDLAVRQLFHQTHVAIENLNMPQKGETVAIAPNVLWEPVTKIVHPKHN